jgi:hypothetical protein
LICQSGAAFVQIGRNMTEQTFGDIAQLLADKGYEPVPIIRGEKRPAPAKWQQGGWQAHASQYSENYTGILTRHNPCVDIDVSHAGLVDAIRDIAYDVTGCYEMPPPRRIGNAPRELLLFRTEEEFSKVSTATYALKTDKPDADGEIKGSKVEILSSGQQFVAYAIHPTTGNPYTWNGSGEPLLVDRQELVTLDESQAREIILRCEALLSLHGTLIGRKPISSGILSDRVPGQRQEANDPIAAIAALAQMPNPDLAFEDWLKVLYAAKGALREEGYAIFMAWSAKSAKHHQDFAEREWRKAKPTQLGAGSLLWVAKSLGWSPLSVARTLTNAKDDFIDLAEAGGEVAGLVWPHMTAGKQPKPLNTLENFAALSDFLKVQYSFNTMSGEEVVTVPNLKVINGYEANAAVTHMVSQAILSGLPHSLVAEYMTQQCLQNPFHPAIDWVETRPWDGVSRIKPWMDTITSPDTKLKEMMMRKWAIGAVAALYQPDGVSAHGVLTLLGDQGIGKTSWFKNLAHGHLLKDGLTLRPDNPDSVRQATSHWMVELGELDATFRKSDIAALKSFLTSDRDIYRLPYARKNTSKPRQTVFFASVNDESFLSDQTGNRRYWTVQCEAINFAHQIDMQQFWAEVKTIYQSGESWYLDHAQMGELNTHNQEFTAVDPIVEKVQTKLNWSADKSRWSYKTSTEVAEMVGVTFPSKGDIVRIALHLKSVQGVQYRRSNGVTARLVPPAVSEFAL